MRGLLLVLLFACTSCAPQPKGARTIAAFEVPLSDAADHEDLLKVLREEAEVYGFHVDADTPEELRQQSAVSPLTINAAVWRGKDDEEIASVMDGADHLGLAWLTFPIGERPERTARFRDSLMRRIMMRWPNTRALPILSTGAIPLHRDLLLTKDGYRVRPAAASTYGLSPSSPLVATD